MHLEEQRKPNALEAYGILLTVTRLQGDQTQTVCFNTARGKKPSLEGRENLKETQKEEGMMTEDGKAWTERVRSTCQRRGHMTPFL